MLYIIRQGDSLFRIAQRYHTSVAALLKANIICNPRLTVSGDLVQIPRDGISLPRLGCGPYYILLPGDSLDCIAHYANTTVSNLLCCNAIHNLRRIYPGMELLICKERPDPEDLGKEWTDRLVAKQIGDAEREKYYQETFAWQSVGSRAVPILLKLLEHPTPEVRYYSILSLGRLGLDQGALAGLEKIADDRWRENRKLARLAVDRIVLSRQGYRRTRLLIKGDKLLDDINRISPAAISLVEGTGVVVLKWFIPAPDGREAPGSGVQIYDYVQVVASGQKGFLARRSPGSELNFI